MSIQHHPTFDFKKWSAIFPIETFEEKDGPRKFDSTSPDSPLDLWKAREAIVTSPAHICEIELVRQRCAAKYDLGEPLPTDIFMWSTSPVEQPYLTKLGGVPHREAAKEWPTASDNTPYTFVAQYCFADSWDVVPDGVPNEVMLVFFKGSDGFYGEDDIHIEWSSLELENPLSVESCPKPAFTVPRLSGVIHRCNEYPDSWDVFEQEGHDQYHLFPTSQSTKIGQDTHYIQGYAPADGYKLFCTLNSVHPSKGDWPFIGLESLPEDWDEPGEEFNKADAPYGWGKYYMMFADVGCLYFAINEKGEVSISRDSY